MNPKYHLLVAVAALSLGACSTDDTCTGPETGGYKISFTVAEDSETRTTLETLDKTDYLRWVLTDKVGIYTAGKNMNSNILTVADVNQSPVEFIGVLEQPVSNGDQFCAYYPYDKEQSANPSEVTLSIPSAQTQTQAGVYNGESHPLVALPKTFEWERDSYAGRISSVRFRQLGAIVELQLYSSNEALRNESIRSVTFESDNTPLAGDFTFDLTTVTDDKEPTISGYESKEATTTLDQPAAIPATKDEAALVYLTIAPGQYLGKIVVKTDVAQYTFNLKNSMDFDRAVIKGLPADLAKAEREILPDASIHFVDSEVKRICVENWDTNSDGELSYKEAAAVTSIESQFIAKSIRSFNELQYFTGLRSIDDAFDRCSSLTSIHLPDGVTAIGSFAFYGCRSLTSIHLPDGVTTIGLAAFSYCTSLASINIPDGVTEIGVEAFSFCTGLTSINIPDGVTTIGEAAFMHCTRLTSINIPKNVSFIGEQAFGGCSSLSTFYGKYASADHRCLIRDGALLSFAPADLTEYTIPDGVTTIGEYAFWYCLRLTSITIPNGVTTIGDYTFSYCSSLTSIHLPDGVTAIGDWAFEYCSSLTSITIDGVATIGTSAFSRCSRLTSIHLSNGVTTIAERAFSGCSRLTSIDIPDGVTAIGESAFRDCSSLTNVYCKPTTPPTLGYLAFDTSSSMKIYVPTASVDAYKTANGWSSYASQIFAQPGPDESDPIHFEDPEVKRLCVENWDTNRDGQLSDKEAAAVTSIGSLFEKTSIRSFNELRYFTGLQAIGNAAFSGCSSLTSINIPQTVSSIGSFVFLSCSSLSAFEGKYASADHRCLIQDGILLAFAPAGLTEYTIPDGVTSIGQSAFSGCSSLTSIHLPEELTTIGDSAFFDCSSLTSINIPDGVTSIGNNAFGGCSSLTNINIPDGVTSIHDEAFWNCSSLTSIHIPDGVTSIGNFAFGGCSSLTSIHIPDGVTSIGYEAFYDCYNLTSIHIPDGVTVIEVYAFRGCKGLTSINIPDEVTMIGQGAFSNCSSLTSINIPDGVTSINDEAFWDCSSLTSVYCKPTTPPTLGCYAFPGASSSLKIYVPAASVEAYKTAENWSDYASQIVADNN